MNAITNGVVMVGYQKREFTGEKGLRSWLQVSLAEIGTGDVLKVNAPVGLEGMVKDVPPLSPCKVVINFKEKQQGGGYYLELMSIMAEPKK